MTLTENLIKKSSSELNNLLKEINYLLNPISITMAFGETTILLTAEDFNKIPAEIVIEKIDQEEYKYQLIKKMNEIKFICLVRKISEGCVLNAN